jgi:predicted DNA-binding transcriptional regulator AlpA
MLASTINIDDLTRDELIALMIGAQTRLIGMSAPAQPAPATPAPAMLTARDLEARFQLSRATLYRLRQRPDFPAPTFLSPREPRWSESAIVAWEGQCGR